MGTVWASQGCSDSSLVPLQTEAPMAMCNTAALTPVLSTRLRLTPTSTSSQDCQHAQKWIYDSYTGNAHRSIC